MDEESSFDKNFCVVCRIQIKTTFQFEEHLRGRKHLAVLRNFARVNHLIGIIL
jgi:hypothetical protein